MKKASEKKKKRVSPEFLKEQYAKARVMIEYDGNFTIAKVKFGRTETVGVTKKSPADPMVPERGAQIATIRALKKLHEVLGK